MPTASPIGKVLLLVVTGLAVLFFGSRVPEARRFLVTDPGVRGGDPGAGEPIAGLTPREQEYFEVAREEFEEAEEVAAGIGPRMNLDSCVGCHNQPASGGSSPGVNPQVAFGSKDGGTDSVPFFIAIDGPIREARFKFNPDGTRDGGVHNTFTITGRRGGDGCFLDQPDFEREFTRNNLIFRIPTPLFGAGLIEQIPDSVILANQAASSNDKRRLGIGGRPNRAKPGRVTGEANNNGNDGTVARFGWKAQNQSVLLFSGEAYNVEMGITNELFQSEREQDLECQFVRVPNNVTDTEAISAPAGGLNAIQLFAFFQRFLAPPTPSTDTPGGAASINNGREVFARIGCALCHTPTLTTGDSTVAALRNQTVNLYSDLLLHSMGPGLADDILQGQARGDEFRTAPLWGVGQRIFFLHDGRTSDLVEAIQEHRSHGKVHRSFGNQKFGPSEANAVIDNFNHLREREKQDVLNFLRSL
jgi:mono/diheme cytochrome c family protein